MDTLSPDKQESMLMQREPTGDSRSPSRKRPRLDDGSRTRASSPDRPLASSPDKAANLSNGHDMQADDRPQTPAASGQEDTLPPPTPSRVTINLREMRGTDSTIVDQPALANVPSGTTANHKSHIPEASLQQSGAVSRSSSSRTDSPIIQVELELSEHGEAHDSVAEIRLDEDDEDDDDSVAAHLDNFPWSSDGDYMRAADWVVRELAKGPELNMLSMLQQWLRSFVERIEKSEGGWKAVFHQHPGLFDLIGKMYQRAFGKAFNAWTLTSQPKDDEMLEVSAFSQDFLDTYTKFLVRTVEADARRHRIRANAVLPVDFIYVSAKFMLAAKGIFQDEHGFVAKVLPYFDVDVIGFRARFIQQFATQNGLIHFLHLVQAIRDDVEAADVTTARLQNAVKIIQAFVYNTDRSFRMQAIGSPLTKSLAQDFLTMFNTFDAWLRNSLEQQKDPLALELRREVLDTAGLLLNVACDLDAERSDELFTKYTGQINPQLRSDYAMLTVTAWKMQLLAMYMSKARMDLRLQGIEALGQLLVDNFNRLKDRDMLGLRTKDPDPLLSFIADMLVEQKIVEYLFGVAAHPQLVQRSHNVIGFLVVTNRFSVDQATLLWRTVVESQDPRVSGAAITILSGLFKGMTIPVENIMMAEIIMTKGLPSLTIQAASFLAEFVNRLRINCQEPSMYGETISEHNFEVAMRFCAYLIQLTFPSRSGIATPEGLFERASEAFAVITPLSSRTIQEALLAQCAENLSTSPLDGAVSAHLIGLIFRNGQLPAKITASYLRLLPGVMKNFCDFVDQARENQTPLELAQLHLHISSRLDLFWSILPEDENLVQKEALEDFWSHLVGEHALNDSARDAAWHRMSFIMFNSSTDKSLLRSYQDFISPENVEPQFYTSEFFTFIQKYASAIFQAQDSLVLKRDGSLNLPGLDMTWQAFLQAPKRCSYDSVTKVARYLVSRYLDTALLGRAARQALEATHVAIVEMCVSYLESAHMKLRSSSPDVSGSESDIAVSQSHVIDEAEVGFLRVIKFLKLFLLHVRVQKDFSPDIVESDTSMSDATSKVTSYRGEKLVLRCELYRTGSRNITHSITIGTLDSCRTLHRRISALLSQHNINSYQVITSGRRLQLKDLARMSLESAGIARSPHLILRESCGDARGDSIPPAKAWRSKFEIQLISHMETFLGFLDGTDACSAAVFELLSQLPRAEKLLSLNADGQLDAAELCPLNQPFKTAYCLETLRDAIDDGTCDGTLMRAATKMLVSRLPSEYECKQGTKIEYTLWSTVVLCLTDMFKAGKINDLNLYIKEDRIIPRLFSICRLLAAEGGNNDLAPICYDLIMELISLSSSAWLAFIEYEDLVLVHQQLLVDMSAETRKQVRRAIEHRISDWPSDFDIPSSTLIEHFWSLVSPAINAATVAESQGAELLGLAGALYKQLLGLGLIAEDSAKQYFGNLSVLLVNHKHHEVVGRGEVDYIVKHLASLLDMSSTAASGLISDQEKLNLSASIWDKFMFQSLPHDRSGVPESVDSTLPVLDTDTRLILVRLLFSLATNESAVKTLCRWYGDATEDVKFHPHSDQSVLIRSDAGYVGLRNLGNTCYMNALVTQLFMNPMFRAFMLSCAEHTSSFQSPLLAATQALFGLMQDSYAKSISAADFTKKIVTLSGEPIDTREQMDADEFMNTLFTRWEEQMPSTALKARFRSVYTGKTVQQIKSRQCEHVSEREDDCTAVQCDIQGYTSLEDSLQAFTQGDVMEGDNKYKCERCDKFVDAVKRTCLKDIPDHLMLQLKRFGYDLETYTRHKVNDYFQFPMNIDMSKYTFGALANPDVPISKDIFDLVGIIVHKGQAEHGHYVSYIRSRPTVDGEAPKWLQFDDSDVTVFDPQEIADLCYGGLAKDGSLYTNYAKSHNAYMLFYQRRSSLQEHPWALKDTKDIQTVPVPPEIEHFVKEENQTILKHYNAIDESSREFMRLMLKQLERYRHDDPMHSLHSTVINVILRYLITVWAKTKDLPDFEAAIDALKAVCNDCHQCQYICIKWFVDSQESSTLWTDYEDLLRDSLLRFNQPKIRHILRSFILETMKKLSSHPAMYGADVRQKKPTFSDSGALTILTRLCRFGPEDLLYNLRAWDDYFGLMADIAELGHQERYVLIGEGALTTCIELILVGTGFDHQIDYRWSVVVEAFKRRITPSYNQIIRLLHALLREIDFEAEQIYDRRYHVGHRCDRYTSSGLPLLEPEMMVLTDYNLKDGGLIWLGELFQKWIPVNDGENYLPGEIAAQFLRGSSSLAYSMVTTLQQVLYIDEIRDPEPFLQAIRFLPPNLKDLKLLEDFSKTVRSMTRGCNDTEGHHAGHYLLQYWRALGQIAQGNRDVDRLYLKYIHDWAPLLLTYTRDFEVGRHTLRLVQETLTAEYTTVLDNDIRTFDQQEDTMLRLFWGCFRQVQYIRSRSEVPWRQLMDPLQETMRACVEFFKSTADASTNREKDQLAEDTKIFEAFEGLEPWFNSLHARSEPDELELAQSSELTAVWAGLDIADQEAFDNDNSDLTEISEDEIGTMLT